MVRRPSALALLCESYWYPLYGFLRRQGHDADAASDLTQGFFTRLIEKEYIADFRREKGRFRTFLLACLRHYSASEHDRSRALKRGGAAAVESLDPAIAEAEVRYAREPVADLTPEQWFERQWALALLDRAMVALRDEQAVAGKQLLFLAFEPFLTADDGATPYARAAADAGVSEGAARTAVHRLRRRFREIVREEIARTVATPEQVGEEVRYMIGVLGRRGTL